MVSVYFAYCNLDTSGVKSFADDLAVRNGPVSGRVALLPRSAEGKPYLRPDFPLQLLQSAAEGNRSQKTTEAPATVLIWRRGMGAG